MSLSSGGRLVSVLASMVMVFTGLALGSLPAEAASKGKVQVKVSAPKDVKAKVTVSKKGAKSFSVTKAKSKKSARKTKSVATGTWQSKPTFVKKGNTFYVAKAKKAKVRKGKTAKLSVKFTKAKVASSPKISSKTHTQVKLKFKAAPKKSAVQLRWAKSSKAPKTVKSGKKVSIKKGATTATVKGLKPNTTYSFSLFTKVSGVWVGPVSLTKVKTGPDPRLYFSLMTRVSVGFDGTGTDGESELPSISADGRYVAFTSDATNLVPHDTNAHSDVFVRDRVANETTRVSLTWDNAQGDGDSFDASISADGRFVAFTSNATNLVLGDSNAVSDVFVHDRETGETTRESVTSAGTQANGPSSAPSISGDGSRVAFVSTAVNLAPSGTGSNGDAYVRDRNTGHTQIMSRPVSGPWVGADAWNPKISADGRFLVFSSLANDLVPGDTNSNHDIFVRNIETLETVRATVSSDGVEANAWSMNSSISADGRYVAFQSWASNLVGGDTNSNEDIFVHDTVTGETALVSVNSAGEQAAGGSFAPSISADGRYVAFNTWADNLVPDDTNGANDIFVHDRKTGKTIRVSVSESGTQVGGESRNPAISGDGNHVVFDTGAWALVPGDTNGKDDIYVWSRP